MTPSLRSLRAVPLRPLRLSLLIVLLLVAAGLRFHQLGAQSLWYDEGNSVAQALRPLMAIADNAARDIHPPGYYWLLAGWRLLAGTSETALRFPSALASLLTVALTYAIGRRLFSPAAGLLAAGVTTLNSFSLYYAQEARMYALLALAGTASLWALLHLIDQPAPRRTLVYGLITAAGLWTHYAYPFVMLAHGIGVVLVTIKPHALASKPHPLAPSLWGEGGQDTTRTSPPLHAMGGEARRVLAAFTAANLIGIGLFAVWLPTALGQVTTWTNTGDATPLPPALVKLASWLVYGVTGEQIALALPIILLLFGLMGLRGVGWLPLVTALVPIAAFMGIGLFREANLKFLLPAQVSVALWMARGAWVLWRSPVRAPMLVLRAAVALLILWVLLQQIAVLPALYDDPAYQRADYRAIAAAVTAEADANDVIILDAPNQAEVFSYYYDGAAFVIGLPEGLGGDDTATRAQVDRLIAAHERLFAVFYGEAERDPNRIVETTLDGGAFEIGDVWYGDVRLARYVGAADLPIHCPTGETFGGLIRLIGCRMNANALSAGDPLLLELTWRADTQIETRYKVFVQLLNEAGILVAQRDSEPGGGLALTTTWQTDQAVTDRHALALPNDLPHGTYRLILGWYDLNDPNARLAVGAGSFIDLATMTVR